MSLLITVSTLIYTTSRAGCQAVVSQTGLITNAELNLPLVRGVHNQNVLVKGFNSSRQGSMIIRYSQNESLVNLVFLWWIVFKFIVCVGNCIL